MMDLITKLQDKSIYPHAIMNFEVIETHVSYVILTGDYAYKIKKTIKFPFLDFSTLEKRKFFCEEELRLNRRTASALYLDVIPIYSHMGNVSFEPKGEIIEYTIKMQQFDQKNLLSNLQSKSLLELATIDKLAINVASFHETANTKLPSVLQNNLDKINTYTQDNFTSCLDFADQSTAEILEDLKKSASLNFTKLENIFLTRFETNMVKECHGDLYLNNIVLIDNEPLPFDCIEFNDDLKFIDTVCDYGFLLMDLEYLGAYNFSYNFLNTYLEQSFDYAGVALIKYYKSYRAMVRAKIAYLTANALSDDTLKQKEISKAKSYINLSKSYAQTNKAKLIITHGVTGSGKSTLSKQLLGPLKAIRIRSDLFRKKLFNLDPFTKTTDEEKETIYSKEATLKTYNSLLQTAKEILSAGFNVIVDACFLLPQERQPFHQLARDLNSDFYILDFTANAAILEQRIAKREKMTDISEGNLSVLELQLKNYQELGLSESKCAIPIKMGSEDVNNIITKLL